MNNLKNSTYGTQERVLSEQPPRAVSYSSQSDGTKTIQRLYWTFLIQTSQTESDFSSREHAEVREMHLGKQGGLASEWSCRYKQNNWVTQNIPEYKHNIPEIKQKITFDLLCLNGHIQIWIMRHNLCLRFLLLKCAFLFSIYHLLIISLIIIDY